MSAIAEFYPNPKVLEGKQIPTLLNIEYKKFRGHESQGMIIATDTEGRVVFLTPENVIPNGSEVI
jgi:methionyl-tRNA synthetase